MPGGEPDVLHTVLLRLAFTAGEGGREIEALEFVRPVAVPDWAEPDGEFEQVIEWELAGKTISLPVVLPTRVDPGSTITVTWPVPLEPLTVTDVRFETDEQGQRRAIKEEYLSPAELRRGLGGER